MSRNLNGAILKQPNADWGLIYIVMRHVTINNAVTIVFLIV